MNKRHQPWIEKGYVIFANEGPTGLKIERLAKAVGKNKSSFYHHFANVTLFQDALLKHHIVQAQQLADKEAKCTTQEALVAILVDHKIDLLFSRQLRVHRSNKDFEACFVKTNQITSQASLGIWSEILHLRENSYLAALVLNLCLENFFLQITPETLNSSWLNNYFRELRTLIKAFKANQNYNLIKR